MPVACVSISKEIGICVLFLYFRKWLSGPRQPPCNLIYLDGAVACPTLWCLRFKCQGALLQVFLRKVAPWALQLPIQSVHILHICRKCAPYSQPLSSRYCAPMHRNTWSILALQANAGASFPALLPVPPLPNRRSCTFFHLCLHNSKRHGLDFSLLVLTQRVEMDDHTCIVVPVPTSAHHLHPPI